MTDRKWELKWHEPGRYVTRIVRGDERDLDNELSRVKGTSIQVTEIKS